MSGLGWRGSSGAAAVAISASTTVTTFAPVLVKLFVELAPTVISSILFTVSFSLPSPTLTRAGRGAPAITPLLAKRPLPSLVIM